MVIFQLIYLHLFNICICKTID
eukprot:UN22532